MPRTQHIDRETAGPKEWLGLVVLAFAVLLIAIDATVLDIALPFLSADLEPTSTQLLWIIDVYSFAVAGLLITMGNLGDRIGRRRLLLIGAAGFGIASLLAACAVSAEMLIAARVLQGISGATLMPATLGLIRTIFKDPRQRVTAIGVWSAMAGGGAAGGPLLGGWLLEHFWWGSVFLINLPLMAALILLGPLVIPESRDPSPGKFDLPSSGLSMLALVPIVYAVKEAAAHGPSLTDLFAALVGVVAGVLFIRRQRILDAPMIDLKLFQRADFSAAVFTNFLSIFALSGVLFFGSQYLQQVLGCSPLEAGLVLLPGTAASAAASLGAAYLVRVWPAGTVLACGLAVSAVGALLLIGLGTDDGLGLFIAGFVLVGIGVGIALTLTSDLVVSAVEPERAGAASAVSETAYELGVALGVAVLGSVVMAIFRRGLDTGGLDPATAAAARETLGGSSAVAADLPMKASAALTDSANAAFVSGMHVASIATAAVLALSAVLVYVRLRTPSGPQAAARAVLNSAK
ncbi:MFS transporter [Williamsia limnetica]|nr:MFS transporter [Williamsia limnetica]